MTNIRSRRERLAWARVSAEGREPGTTRSSTFVRIGLIALIIVMLALAGGQLASIALPMTALVVAGLGAAAVAEANRRWQPGPARQGRQPRSRERARPITDTRPRRAES